jgi:hypothetical protein
MASQQSLSAAARDIFDEACEAEGPIAARRLLPKRARPYWPDGVPQPLPGTDALVELRAAIQRASHRDRDEYELDLALSAWRQHARRRYALTTQQIGEAWTRHDRELDKEARRRGYEQAVRS